TRRRRRAAAVGGWIRGRDAHQRPDRQGRPAGDRGGQLRAGPAARREQPQRVLRRPPGSSHDRDRALGEPARNGHVDRAPAADDPAVPGARLAASVSGRGSQLTTSTRIRSPVAGVDLRFSVVICAYTERRWDDIVGAVASVRAQTRPPVRTVLVVDHNPSLLARARVAFPELVVVPNSGRRGLSGGRNTGVFHAIGDVVAFLDHPAWAQPEWLERLAAGYRNPSVVGVGGAATPVWPGQRPPWLPPEFDWVVGCTFLGMPTAPAPVRNLIGANMSFRRDALDTVGGFNDGLGRVGTRPLGCEETELGIRLRQWRTEVELLYEPTAARRHRAPESAR